MYKRKKKINYKWEFDHEVEHEIIPFQPNKRKINKQAKEKERLTTDGLTIFCKFLMVRPFTTSWLVIEEQMLKLENY